MKPLYEWLGLSVSLGFVDIQNMNTLKMKNMNCTTMTLFTTNGRLGFDYLIDNLADDIRAKFYRN